MLYIASDHAGFKRKEEVKKFLEKQNIRFKDLGTNTDEKLVDYPDYAKKVCKEVKKSILNKGILICGSGTGMAIAANRNKGIRATLCYDTYSAKMSRRDNNANILCLRGLEFTLNKTIPILKTWLNTKASTIARYKKRSDKLDK